MGDLSWGITYVQALSLLQGWTDGLKKYMDSLKTKDNINGKAYSSRYIGSLVRLRGPWR
jgi:fructose-1,6-bisphosphatase